MIHGHTPYNASCLRKVIPSLLTHHMHPARLVSLALELGLGAWPRWHLVMSVLVSSKEAHGDVSTAARGLLNRGTHRAITFITRQSWHDDDDTDSDIGNPVSLSKPICW